MVIAFNGATSASELELKAIVPDHVGLTLQKSPVLYYFISEPTTLPVRFTLIESRTDHVVVDMLLRSPDHSGFWPVRLEEYGIVLDPGVEYRWFVTVIKNADSPSKDLVAGGAVECCPDDLVYDAPPCVSAQTPFLSMQVTASFQAKCARALSLAKDLTAIEAPATAPMVFMRTSVIEGKRTGEKTW
jgi:hypothetical protein